MLRYFWSNRNRKIIFKCRLKPTYIFYGLYNLSTKNFMKIRYHSKDLPINLHICRALYKDRQKKKF